MIPVAAVRRYADGFLAYAGETIGINNGLEELKNLRDVFRVNPAFREFLENPIVGYDEKCGVIEKTLSAAFSQEARHFLMLLLKKNRIESFADIAEYARIKYGHAVVDALLTASYPLDTEAIKAVKEKVEEKLKQKLHLHVGLDPDLLGGIRMTVGNTIIDGSVKQRLKELKEKLMGAKVS